VKQAAEDAKHAAEKKAAEAKKAASNAANSAGKRAAHAGKAAEDGTDTIVDALKGLYHEAEQEIMREYPVEIEEEPLIAL
jgi:hypothetical protein